MFVSLHTSALNPAIFYTKIQIHDYQKFGARGRLFVIPVYHRDISRNYFNNHEIKVKLRSFKSSDNINEKNDRPTISLRFYCLYFSALENILSVYIYI